MPRRETFCIRLDGEVIELSVLYDRMKRMCKGYLTEGEAGISVKAEEAEIENMISRNRMCADKQNGEELVLQGKVNDWLIAKGKAMLHAACVAYKDKCVAFSAPSGVGKSTHAGLWLREYQDEARIINGDFPLISVKENGVYASGTPWCGKEGFNENVTLPLAAVCFIERGKENRIVRIGEKEILNRIFKQLLMPEGDELMEAYMRITQRIITSVPFYVLSCNISAEAARTAKDAIFGGEEQNEDK